MRRYTVFMRPPDADIDDPAYWSQVKAKNQRAAVAEAVRRYGIDAVDSGAYDAGEEPGVEDFGVIAVVYGWPNFRLGENLR